MHLTQLPVQAEYIILTRTQQRVDDVADTNLVGVLNRWHEMILLRDNNHVRVSFIDVVWAVVQPARTTCVARYHREFLNRRTTAKGVRYDRRHAFLEIEDIPCFLQTPRIQTR